MYVQIENESIKMDSHSKCLEYFMQNEINLNADVLVFDLQKRLRPCLKVLEAFDFNICRGPSIVQVQHTILHQTK